LILDDIANAKRAEVEARKIKIPVLSIDDAAPVRDFFAAIAGKKGTIPKVIAEVKKASPSKGVIRPDFDPIKISSAYESAGAAAISVLTDEQFFQGHLNYLTQCRKNTSLPVLRKDFIIDLYQIDEARAACADAVLLIAALLDTAHLRAFREHAEGLGMSALVEVHNEQELDSALESGANIIGINNRNLYTFEVDMKTTLRLVPKIPEDKIIVSESGIRTKEDLAQLADCGVNAVLIGETLMRASEPGEKLRELIGQ
jgi:indole-3-glycerol phosphate synthase